MTRRSTSVSHDDDWILHLIVIFSILIEILIDALKCLTSLNSASSTPTPGKHDLKSNGTKSTSSGSTKTQRLSPSTKRRSTTAVQRKEIGTSMQDTLSKPSASSPKSRRSKPTSSTQTSTKSGTSRTLGFQTQTRTMTSISPTNTLRSTPKPNHTTADDNSRRLQPNHGSNTGRQSTHDVINTSDGTRRFEHQPTEHLHVLPKPQEEVPEHTVLRTKVSRSKLKT